VADPASAAGRLVAVPLGALARLRRGKPMHPRGAVFDGLLERTGNAPAWGVPWLDAETADQVLVRFSRGAGVPAPWPDLLGLAVRVPGPEQPIDLLLTTTGSGPLLRWVPLVRRDAAVAYTSIMGYRSDAGSLRIAAFPEFPSAPSEPAALAEVVRDAGLSFTLAAARGAKRWRPFGRLTLTAPRQPLDPDVRFDAVQHPPPGLTADGPMARFRAPAYARAREQRTLGRLSRRD
jgi:hypothetical protein